MATLELTYTTQSGKNEFGLKITYTMDGNNAKITKLAGKLINKVGSYSNNTTVYCNGNKMIEKASVHFDSDNYKEFYNNSKGFSVTTSNGYNNKIKITFNCNNASKGVQEAHFDANRLVYNANGGSGSVPETKFYAAGTSLSLRTSPLPTKTGCNFKGWSTDKKTIITSISSLPDTVYAVWEVQTHVITFNANGGSVNPSAISFTYGTNYNNSYLNGVNRAGYTFNGWYSGDICIFDVNGYPVPGTVYFDGSRNYIGASDLTVYASWSPVTYSITYSGCKAKTPPDQVKTTDVDIYLRHGDEPIGYIFNGWTNTSGSHYDGGALFKGNFGLSLTAGYSPIAYTVSYNGNGADGGSTAASSHTYDVAKSLTTNGYTRQGYKFLGWSTDPEATTAALSDGQSVVNLTATNEATIILYAVWKVVRNVRVNVNNQWRDGFMYVNIGNGQWRRAEKVYINTGSGWKVGV